VALTQTQINNQLQQGEGLLTTDRKQRGAENRCLRPLTGAGELSLMILRTQEIPAFAVNLHNPRYPSCPRATPTPLFPSVGIYTNPHPQWGVCQHCFAPLSSTWEMGQRVRDYSFWLCIEIRRRTPQWKAQSTVWA